MFSAIKNVPIKSGHQYFETLSLFLIQKVFPSIRFLDQYKKQKLYFETYGMRADPRADSHADSARGCRCADSRARIGISFHVTFILIAGGARCGTFQIVMEISKQPRAR